jgi:hypothetical protein
MKNVFSRTLWLRIACLAALPAQAQDSTEAFQLLEPKADTPNHVSAAYRMAFNIHLDYKSVGGFASPNNPGPATGGALDRTYADGYNKVDITGNNHGPGFENTTWYWGYNNASQIRPAPDNPQSVVMHDYSSPGVTSAGQVNAPAPGFELAYRRDLLNKKSWLLGVEAAFAYTALTADDSAPVTSSITQLNDSFGVPPDLSGQPLPPPGYQGTRTGIPGGSNPVIGSNPNRTFTYAPEPVTGFHSFGADLFNFRVGPYLEVPLSRRVVVNLSGGFALLYARSDFSFSETFSEAGTASMTIAGSNSDSDVLLGGYVAGGISVEFAKGWTAFTGAQFEDVGEYTHTSASANRAAVVDLRRAVFVTVGVSYSF